VTRGGSDPRSKIGAALHLLRWLEELAPRWESHAIGPDTFWQSLRGCLENVRGGKDTWRPQTSLRERLERMLAGDGPTVLTYQYRHLAEALEVYLRLLGKESSSPYVSDLINRLYPAPTRTEEKRSRIWPMQLASLESFGRAGKTLRSLVANQHADTPIILTGGDPIKLLELCGAYAMALLCEAPRGGCSCGACQSCENFKAGQHLGLVPPVDVGGVNGRERLRQVLEKTRTPTLAGRTVIVLDRIQECDPATLDMLLKTIEEPPTRCATVLLCSDLSRIGPAVRSRAQLIRLEAAC